MIWAWIALLAAGTYVVTSSSAKAAASAPALSLSQLQLAVNNAIAHETNPAWLTDFAQTLQPSNPALAAQLTARATLLTALTTRSNAQMTLNITSQAQKFVKS
jgi:aspartate aminotransferase-like enzyme